MQQTNVKAKNTEVKFSKLTTLRFSKPTSLILSFFSVKLTHLMAVSLFFMGNGNA